MTAGVADAEWHDTNGIDQGNLPNGGHHIFSSAGQNGNGIGHNYPDENSLPTDSSEMELGDDEVDYQHGYPGMTRDDITKRLKDILGSTYSSSRPEEIESLCHMVYGQPEQEALLQLMQANKATLIGSQCLPRALAQLQWPCSSCGESGHSADKCPANSAAAAAAADLDEAGGAAGSDRAKSNADKKAKKRSKRATKEAQAESAITSTADGSSVADSEAAAAGAEGEAAAAGDGAAKPAERGARGKGTAAARQPAAEPAAAEDDDDEEDGEEGAAGDDDLTQLISTFAPGRSKAGTKAGLAVPPPQPRDDPNRSSSADAADAASAVSSGNGGPGDATKDTEQPQQKEDGKRGRNRGADSKRKGNSDVEQGTSARVDSKGADPVRPSSSSGPGSQQQQQRPDRRSDLKCRTCGQVGHIKADCPEKATSKQRVRHVDGNCYKCGEWGHIRDDCPNEEAHSSDVSRQQPQPRQQRQPRQQQQQPASPSHQPYNAMQDIHSALGHAPPPHAAQPGGWADMVKAQPGVSGAMDADSVWGVPAGRDGGGIGLPPGLQQQQHMLPREAAPGPEEDDDINDLLGNLGVETSAPTPWGGAGQTWSPAPGALPHPLQQARQLTPAQERERQEQEELDAALKASMEDTRGFGRGPLSGQAPTGGKAVAGAGAGLANDTGEYNCFLNAIIQCVWRCRDFRDSIVQLDPDEMPNDEGNPRIVRELVLLFKAVDEQQRADASPEAPRAVVSPNGLREALSHTAEFKLGEMNDAAEVLRMLYDALIQQGHRDMVTACFGLDIHESVRCRHCDMETHALRYTQYFQQVPAAALRKVAEQDPDNALGYYLVAIDKQTRKTCDKDVGGCGRPNQVGHRVQGLAPKVFSIELAWQNNQETAEDIAETLSVVDLFLDPSQRYQALQPKRQRLVAMVCYYGKHYMAFVLVKPTAGASGPGGWLLLDDANATEVGDWDAVLDKCKAGRIQPSVLLYEDTQGWGVPNSWERRQPSAGRILASAGRRRLSAVAAGSCNVERLTSPAAAKQETAARWGIGTAGMDPRH